MPSSTVAAANILIILVSDFVAVGGKKTALLKQALHRLPCRSVVAILKNFCQLV